MIVHLYHFILFTKILLLGGGFTVPRRGVFILCHFQWAHIFTLKGWCNFFLIIWFEILPGWVVYEFPVLFTYTLCLSFIEWSNTKCIHKHTPSCYPLDLNQFDNIYINLSLFNVHMYSFSCDFPSPYTLFFDYVVFWYVPPHGYIVIPIHYTSQVYGFSSGQISAHMTSGTIIFLIKISDNFLPALIHYHKQETIDKENKDIGSDTLILSHLMITNHT